MTELEFDKRSNELQLVTGLLRYWVSSMMQQIKFYTFLNYVETKFIFRVQSDICACQYFNTLELLTVIVGYMYACVNKSIAKSS